MFKLVIDFQFLDLDGQLSLLDEVALLLFSPHVTESVLLNILNILHVDKQDLLNS